MKWLIYLGAGAAALVAAAFALALILVDADEVTNAAAGRLSRQIGLPIELGEVDLTLFPFPAVHVADVRVSEGASAGGQADLVHVDDVKLELSLFALFAGQIVLRSVNLDGLQLELPVSASGWPALDQIRRNPSAAGAADGDDGPRLLITQVSVSNGSVRAGSWALDQIEATGGGNLDLTADLDFSARIPGIGDVREGSVEFSNLIEGPVRWDARVELDAVDVAALREQIAPERAIWGKAQATLEFSGEASSLGDARIEASFAPLDARSSMLSINGDATLSASLGQAFELRFDQAELDVAKALRKPVGVPARFGGSVPRSFDSLELDDVSLRLGESELAGDVRMVEGEPRIELRGSLDLESLSSWTDNAMFPSAGRLEIEQLVYRPQRELRGQGRAEDMRVDLGEKRQFAVSGPVFVDGTIVGGNGITVEYEKERFLLTGSYDLVSERADLRVEANGVDLTPLSVALTGEPQIAGRLYGAVQLNGPLSLPDLQGSGQFEIPGGEMARASLEEILATAQDAEAPDGFRRMAGVFTLGDSLIRFSRLEYEQGPASALFTGTISLLDGIVDLNGQIQALVGPEPVERFAVVAGRLGSLTATVEEPMERDEMVKQLKVQERMLRAMKEAIANPAEGSPAGDPETAAYRRLQLERIQTQLNVIDQKRETAGISPDEGPPLEDESEPFPDSAPPDDDSADRGVGAGTPR